MGKSFCQVRHTGTHTQREKPKTKKKKKKVGDLGRFHQIGGCVDWTSVLQLNKKNLKKEQRKSKNIYLCWHRRYPNGCYTRRVCSEQRGHHSPHRDGNQERKTRRTGQCSPLDTCTVLPRVHLGPRWSLAALCQAWCRQWNQHLFNHKKVVFFCCLKKKKIIITITQAWSSAGPRGQWRTGKNGENWLWNHLWCPNNPRG